MAAQSNRRHVFISHHHADDKQVDKLSALLERRGFDLRNSSIRAKPANQRRLDRGMVSDETIRRLLRRKISWASTTIVLIGKATHSRKWVNWEIEQAHKQGKRIVGVFSQGATDADKPSNFEKYGCALASWNTDSIIRAVDGEENIFETSSGENRPSTAQTVSQC